METIKLPCLKLLPTAQLMLHQSQWVWTCPTLIARDKVLVEGKIPMGYYGQIASRSGLAIHHHIHVGAGVVDPDYTNVLLMNFSSQDHVIEHRSADDSRKSGLSGHL